MLKIKHIITLTFILCSFCISLSAQKEYADSIFHASIAEEQIKDSTLEDKLKHNLFEAKKLQLKGKHTEALNLLNKNIFINSTAEYSELYSATAFLLYESYKEIGKNHDAISCIDLAHYVSPKNIDYLRELATTQYNFKYYDLAIENFKKLNKLNPYNTNDIYNLFEAYLQTSQYKNALKELNNYEKLEGHSIHILAYRVAIHQILGQSKKSEKEIIKYIAKYPEDHYDASMLLHDMYFKSNKTQKAIDLLNSLNIKYKNDPNILLKLANIYNITNQDSLYQQYTIQAIKTNNLPVKKTIEVIRPIISGYIQNADTSNISFTLNTLTSLYPNDADILTLQADIFKAQKDTINWKETLYKKRKLTNDENVNIELISIAEQQKDKKEILSLTKEGYYKYKTDPWALYYIISLAQNEQNDTLILESEQILPQIETANIKSDIFQIIGDIYQSQEKTSQAMQMYDSCLVYDPNNTGALNNIAYNITKESNPDLKKAEKMAAKALELNPETTYILDTYAWILFLQGDN